MKSSDYIIDFCVNHGIKHFFGYQGTMIAHFVDSIYRNENAINHSCYNEQGAGFAAVGYAKTTGKTALAYATSGPGAANLISAIADAYYDSAPVIFITGQLNTYEYLGIEGIRQNGFQEMNVVAAVKEITKYCTKVEKAEDLRYVLEKAYYMTTEGRPGPVVIDLPMDMQRQEINPEELGNFDPKTIPVIEEKNTEKTATDVAEAIGNALKISKAPVIMLGNGIIKGSEAHKRICDLAARNSIPVITSMLGRDLMAHDDVNNLGHIGGGYGHRYANIIAYKKADLIVALGCSLCKRQTAMKTEKFAENARIIRVDIDPKELERKVHVTEESYLADCTEVIKKLAENQDKYYADHGDWLEKCTKIKSELEAFDVQCVEREPNRYIDVISENTEDGTAVCCDVGQHQVWASQSFKLKPNQKLLFSGGHGAMGFALPASIGAHYATGGRTMAICGDGAMQMNIQELQWIFREQIPVTIVVLNNRSLGLIQQQQDDIFNSLYAGSMEEGGYMAPDFQKIGTAYGIESYKVKDAEELAGVLKETSESKPVLIEVIMDEKSRAYPKTYFGEEMYNQRPYIPDELLDMILKM